MFKIMLLEGKKGITRKWLKVEAPRMENWVDVIHDIYVMEKLTSTCRFEMDKFKRLWNVKLCLKHNTRGTPLFLFLLPFVFFVFFLYLI